MLCEHIIFYLATSEQALQHVALCEVTVDASRQGIPQSEPGYREIQGLQQSVAQLPAALGKRERERERERVYFTNKPYLEMACSCGT